jgi:hypothetical protein
VGERVLGDEKLPKNPKGKKLVSELRKVHDGKKLVECVHQVTVLFLNSR